MDLRPAPNTLLRPTRFAGMSLPTVLLGGLVALILISLLISAAWAEDDEES